MWIRIREKQRTGDGLIFCAYSNCEYRNIRREIRWEQFFERARCTSNSVRCPPIGLPPLGPSPLAPTQPPSAILRTGRPVVASAPRRAGRSHRPFPSYNKTEYSPFKFEYRFWCAAPGFRQILYLGFADTYRQGQAKRLGKKIFH